MTLDLVVGALVGFEQRDVAGYNRARSQFDAVSNWFRQLGLPQYREPDNCDELSLRVGPYSYIHYLRRMAAHLTIRGELPSPGDDNASKDPYLKQYVDRAFNENKIGPFDHLIIHQDSDDYYVPLDFNPVVAPPKEIGIDCWTIGSSIGLLRECEQIATYLQVPIRIFKIVMGHLGTRLDYHNDGSQLWQKYPVESHVCTCLILGCRRSIRTGAALVFA
jgi:hypothetical protein